MSYPIPMICIIKSSPKFFKHALSRRFVITCIVSSMLRLSLTLFVFQVLALAHVEGPDGKIALASATPVCKHEMRVMLRLFNTLEVVNQRPAYTNPLSDTQIFYALRYDPPQQTNGAYTILHEEKKEGGENDYLEDFDDLSHVSAIS